MADTNDESRIRDEARKLWEADGRPDGKEDSYWTQAKEIVALKDSYASTLTPVEDTIEEPAEPAIAFENQADVPGLTDLGEGPRGPSFQEARNTVETDTPGAEGRPGYLENDKRQAKA